MAEQDSARARRHGGREGFGVQGKIRRLELHKRRLKPDVARIKRIVEPAGNRNDDVVTRAGCSPQCDMQGCHRPGCENDVSKGERKVVTFAESFRHVAPDKRLPPERGVLQIEQPLVLERLGDSGSGSALGSGVRIRIREVREPVSESTRFLANALEALERL
jgi:hypothetical protein